jgi:hypothetical protein
MLNTQYFLSGGDGEPRVTRGHTRGVPAPRVWVCSARRQVDDGATCIRFRLGVGLSMFLCYRSSYVIMVAEIGRWSLQVDPVTRMTTQYESSRRICGRPFCFASSAASTAHCSKNVVVRCAIFLGGTAPRRPSATRPTTSEGVVESGTVVPVDGDVCAVRLTPQSASSGPVQLF